MNDLRPTEPQQHQCMYEGQEFTERGPQLRMGAIMQMAGERRTTHQLQANGRVLSPGYLVAAYQVALQ